MMKGTPYIYQGEEIGMTNTPITDIREARDIETINMYHEYLEKGYSKEEILLKINTKGRDNARLLCSGPLKKCGLYDWYTLD